MSEDEIGKGGLTAPLRGREFTHVFGDDQRPVKKPISEGNTRIGMLLAEGRIQDAFELMEEEKQKNQLR